MLYSLKNLETPVITKKQAEQDNIEHALAGLAIGFAAGVILGASIAILAAPKSGKETRTAIKDATGGAVGDVKEKTLSVKNKIKSKVESKKSCCQTDENEFVEIPLSEEDQGTEGNQGYATDKE